ncbi:MAG: hypothetical protein WCJ37_17450 [Syntrophus sp. (in: bacteria)]
MTQRLRLVSLFCLVMFGTGAAIVFAQTSMADFGLDENVLKSRIVNSLTYGSVPAYPNKKLFREASPSAQAGFIKNTLSWVKTYTESATFKSDYEKQRQSAKPSPPISKGSPDEQFAKFQAEQRQNLETMKKNVATMSPDMKKQMQGAIKQMETSAEMSAKDPQMAAMLKEGYKQNALNEQKDYENRLNAWGKKYPADPRALIAVRLHQFLELSQDIPFEAKLVPGVRGKMKFADPQYEAKSSQWKQCFRAGRVPVQTARAFAQEWLSQIEKK